ncbi:hypothetical protein GLV88_02465 [Staphylococcus hyicus]|uniref:coagulase domain-containing protein n=1 Tax=Staphylococcus hyicus TaxID=1284 RepID=UPI00142FA9C1|nr:coagulase domain-containing protein [Staphylococcus hyicus]NJH99325.1 hypothetical protein [Staphylococcus hyicus]NJI30430.1 hypothetical protein [Staphylococcus hyicus]
MKKKLLVLSASAILASNFILDNNASAVVKKSDYESEALKIEGTRSQSISLQSYKDNLKNLIYNIGVSDFDGYDEPEYKDAYQKYQGRFLAELDALNQFILEQTNDDLNYYYVNSKKKLGLTQERYKKVYDALIKNKEDFNHDVSVIESKYKDLQRYNNDDEFFSDLYKLYDLEDKALMSARAFSGPNYKDARYKDARQSLYTKLDLIVGNTSNERKERLPLNKRMFKETHENLETVIDEFYKEIGFERPLTIEPLTEDNKNNVTVLSQVRENAQKAKDNENFRDPGVKQRADKLKEANEKALAEREAKAKELKEKGLLRGKEFNARNYPLYFPHKKLNNNSKVQKPSEKQLVFKEVNEQPKQHLIYTETVTSTPQPVLKQEKREEIVTPAMAPRFNQNNTLKGMEGESAPVTVVSEPAIKATSAPQTKEAHTGFSGSNNNLSGMGGESKEVSFTYDSQPVDFDIITESNEIVLDQHTDIKVSGYTTGESIEDSRPSNEVTK